ncbi:MAG TPA: GDSL-type esterase/lipase family protein [Rhodocyclaceae bacterium]|nr:GDSL-type esterase/lipase family protein [Rhodocyclaceae bacterium]
MLGDSTLTTYTDAERPQMGWGERIGLHFDSTHVKIKNWAAGGRSSRSFYYESTMWPAAKAAIKAGDYVIIQFGHNDQKYGDTTSTGPYSTYGTYAICSDPTITDGEACTGGTDIVDATTTRDEHSYYQMLKRYVTQIQALGAYPILATPMVRREVTSGVVTASGQHDYSAVIKGTEANPRGNYPAAVKAVGAKYNVPVLDITADTKAIVEVFGSTPAADALYMAADNTHPQIMYASLIAKRAADDIKAIASLSALGNYVIAAPTIQANAYPVAFGPVTVGEASIKSLGVSAFDLSPAAGTLTVTAPSEVQLSADQTTWSQTLSLAYTGGALTKVVYARFTPTLAKAYSASIVVTSGSTTAATVAFSGTGSAAPTDYVSWFSAGTATSPLITGRLSAAAVTPVGLTAPTTTDTVTWSVNGVVVTPARYISDTWIAPDATKYLQFSVTPTVALNITNISMYFASYGGSNLRANLEYSLSADFSNPVRLNDVDLTTSKEILTQAKYTISVPVSAGATLYVRVFPWQKTATTATKGIALYSVTVGGVTP